MASDPTQDTTPMPGRRTVHTNGIDMAVYEAGPADGLPVVLVHGFPELAYSWRHQMQPLADAGYRAIAPDLRGYGETGPQGDFDAYRMQNLGLDLVGLLDGLGISQAVLVGHDFGGALVWAVARDHADRVLGVISLNTPYTRRAKMDLIAAVREFKGPDHYMVTFQTPGVGEALLGDDVEETFRGLMRRPGWTLAQFEAQATPAMRALPATLLGRTPELQGEPLLSEAELAVFVQAFQRHGFTGPLNWYRNMPRNWRDTEGVPDTVHAPSLMVSATDDILLPPAVVVGMERQVPNLEKHLVGECGHWTQQERPEQVNTLMLGWLLKTFGPQRR